MNRTIGWAHLLLLLPLLVVMAACRSGAPDAASDDAQAYGETGGIANAVAAADIAEAPEAHLNQTVTVEGRVTQVCQRKGCWLVLDTGGAPIRVHVPRTETDKYAFTVPTDISGAQATVRGTLQRVTLDAATHQHMTEDAGESASAEPEPATELQIIAGGIIITPSRT